MPALLQRIQRRGGAEVADLAGAVGAGPWLCIAPHDDDACLGMGLALAAARAEGIAVHLGVVSDGSLGHARADQAAGLVAVRRAELRGSCARLGLADGCLHELGLPDGELCARRGARRDGTGLGQALCALLRRVRPAVVFGPSPTDLHPDHQAVAADLGIACFWAAAGLWLELGPPIPLPSRWEYAVYAPFAADPDLRLVATAAGAALRAEAFACFASQQYVAGLAGRRVEHLRRVPDEPCRPDAYDHLFPTAP